MFLIELMAMRLDIFGSHSRNSDFEIAIPVANLPKGHSRGWKRRTHAHGGVDNQANYPVRSDEVSTPPEAQTTSATSAHTTSPSTTPRR